MPVYDEFQDPILLTDATVVTSNSISEDSSIVTWADFKQTAMTEDFKRTTTYATLSGNEKNLASALIDAQDMQGDMSALGATNYLKYEAVLHNGTYVDYFNNEFIENSQEYCSLRSDTETIADFSLTNWEKGGWYISIYPLPDVIKELPIVSADLIFCASTIALWKRVEMNAYEKEWAYSKARDNNDQVYNVASFTGFVHTALMCQTPLDY